MPTNPLGPMTVVLDTNVVVAALLWEGVPRRLLERIAGDPLLILVSSPGLLNELARVLTKPPLLEKVDVLATTPGQLVATYKRLVRVVAPPAVPSVVVGDPDDDHVLALAVAARATFIVSGDHAHLLPIGRYGGIAIVTPREAFALLG